MIAITNYSNMIVNKLYPVQQSRGVNLSFAFFLMSTMLFMGQAMVATVLAGVARGKVIVPIQVFLVYLSIVLFYIFSPTDKPLKNKKYFTPIWVGFFIVFLILVYDSIGAKSIEDFKKTFQFITGLFIFILAYHFSSDENKCRLLLRSIFITILLASVVGFIDFTFRMGFSWSAYAESGWKDFRIVGFENTPVSLAYGIVAPCTMAVVFIYNRKLSYANPGIVLSFLTAILGLGLLIGSSSRSGTLGVIAGSFIAFILFNIKRRWWTFLLISCTLIFIFTSVTLFNYFAKGGLNKVKHDARLGENWEVYVPIILTYPLGSTKDREKRGELSDVYETLGIKLDKEVYFSIRDSAPHNSFLTTGLTYGWIGLAYLFWIYVYYLRIGWRLVRNRAVDQHVRVFTAALLGGILAFLVHSWFHNASILMGEMRNWLYLGLLSGSAARYLTSQKRG